MLGVDPWRGVPLLPYARRLFCTPLSRTAASDSDARSGQGGHRSDYSVSCFLSEHQEERGVKTSDTHVERIPSLDVPAIQFECTSLCRSGPSRTSTQAIS